MVHCKVGVDIMSFDYILFILVIIGIFIGFSFWKLIKHFKYEMNFKESLLFPISILALTVICLTDFSLLKTSFDYRICTGILIYFLVLLILYYIIRSIKLKKYIPVKAIIYYTFMGFIFLWAVLYLLESPVSNINGWDALGLAVLYVVFCILFIGLLILMNVIIFLKKIIIKDKTNFNNINYKISKFSYLGIVMAIAMIELYYNISYYNELNYNKMLEHQKEIVLDYLDNEYPEYKFVITNTYESKVDCWMFGCKTPVIRNDIVNETIHRKFSIDVKKEDLTIYVDGFKTVLEEWKKTN